jgi:hypothetical protein
VALAFACFAATRCWLSRISHTTWLLAFVFALYFPRPQKQYPKCGLCLNALHYLACSKLQPNTGKVLAFFCLQFSSKAGQ